MPTVESEEVELGEKDHPFGALKSETASVASAEDREEQLAALREQMEVWVDPNERDGLPTTAGDPQASSEKRAKALMRVYTRGAIGFLKQRKTGRPGDSFKSGKGAGQDVENGPAESEIPPLAANGGILAALIALNSQPDSLPGSTNPSPGHSTATTPGGTPLPGSPVDSDDSDDEAERERFLAKQRARRAGKNSFHATSAVLAGATKSAAASAYSLATTGSARPRSVDGDRPYRRTLSAHNLGPLGGSHLRSTSPSPPPSRPASLYAHHRSRSQVSLQEHFGHSSPPTSPVKKSFSSSALSNLVASAESPPSNSGSRGRQPRGSQSGGGVAKQLRRLGGHLGLEVDSPASRPDAARSKAGVFGGLVASTVRDFPPPFGRSEAKPRFSQSNLAGVASPSANALAPMPSKAGYHLSRYTPKSLDNARGRKSAESLPRVGSQPRLSRGASADSVPQVSRIGSPPPSVHHAEREPVEKTAEEIYEEDEEPEMLSMLSRRQRKGPVSLRLKDMVSHHRASSLLLNLTDSSCTTARPIVPFQWSLVARIIFAEARFSSARLLP